MKVRTYVLVVSTALITMAAATNKSGNTEGLNPGDLAPGIKSLGDQVETGFRNHSGSYTLLNFWATYDAESRARNVKLSNEIARSYAGMIQLCSVSLDENSSIFRETVKIDRLDETTQFQETLGRQSALFRKYKLDNGFGNYLINSDGVIIAKNVTPEKLTELMNVN